MGKDVITNFQESYGFNVWTTKRVLKDFEKAKVITYNNVSIFLQIGYTNDEQDYSKKHKAYVDSVRPWAKLYLPMDIVNMYDFEGYFGKPVDDIQTGELVWKRFYTDPIFTDPNDKRSFEWDSGEDKKDFVSREEIIQSSKLGGSDKVDEDVLLDFEEIKNTNIMVLVGYNEQADNRTLRVFQCMVKNINGSKWIRNNLLMSASKFFHDYATYKSLRKNWKRSPFITPKGKIIHA